ncbi:MAG TPA: DUF1385 domain-containing protein [Dehalococcoidia bacterium]|jgi:uncharacterized protein YqhQ|nr:DUF1385 domain-containing protein [Dehalococcoidia bacterium]
MTDERIASESSRSPYGGQALIEGVMIRGLRAMAMAARTPDGRIITRSDLADATSGDALRKVPFVRGVLTLYDTFTLGIRSLYWSARVAAGREDEPASKREYALAGVSMTAAAAVFIAGPVLMTGWIDRAGGSAWAEVLAEGGLRIAMLLGYIWFIGRLPEVQRVFSYHGAEHRTIHAYEHGEPLTVDAVRTFANAHPRCGTAFLLTVGVLSFAVFTMLGTPSLTERIVERVVLTPVIAAMAYEFIRMTQQYEAHPVLRLLQSPNLWLQRMTTRDPDDTQIEVAIAAMNAVLAAEASVVANEGATPAPVQVPVED